MSKSVLITDCSEGLRVYATARSKSKMAHLDNLTNVKVLELDDSETPDILVNNAGQSMVCPALDTSIDDAKTLFGATQAFAPLVIAAKGTIVNVCSIPGLLYAPWKAFNVKVLSLVTGSVAINVMSLDNIHLPANSLYKKSIHQIQKRDVGEDAVANDVLSGATGPVWRGAMASMDRIMKSGTDLNQLP
ncbi:uncharacterized protein BDW43DRAFT_300599 [Aspergillus alliaceus]|uniref:uncharacterized protein n=1 Tax=Petromyces alliaceus TaxID=209559 RepID=UPI0012A6109A|nr:uncharacterized protein BDW43DRAFT_300599 [Aspergillus alliaceus]KAB8233168.1 hypothetical protein BDW43DRAFT_300599 [Aspergillus alliaceus]